MLLRARKSTMVKRLNKLLLILLAGVLLWLSWYPHGFTFLIFIAFVPLFLLSDKLLESENGLTFWQGIWNSFPAFLIWNLGVTWWIWNSTIPGAIVAIVLNSFFMSCVFAAWHWVKKSNIHRKMIPLAFIAFWCSWEYLHLNWQIVWPWLNLGNLFAVNTKIVQWYEYTGTFGGTIWILCINFLCYFIYKQLTQLYKHVQFRHNIIRTVFALFFSVIIPIIISFIIYKTYTINRQTAIEAIIIQHNIDPWEEQYMKTNLELAELIIEIAAPKLTPSTELLICSESALSHTINEEQLDNLDISPHKVFQYFDLLFHYYPGLNIILGISTEIFFDKKVSAASREYSDGIFAEYYNTACLYCSDTLQLYRKSKLVPGVEKMPYPKIFGFLETLAIDLGGISGSLGVDTEQRVFHARTRHGVVKLGVPICYESIFGEHFSEFVRNGAQLMCVITNDSWWGDTPGYKQHFAMSALRAIETRRYILRAANSGISAFFDPLGNLHQKTKYETRTAISQTVYLNDKLTFYTKYGDYLAKIMIGIALLFFLNKIFCSKRKTILQQIS